MKFDRAKWLYVILGFIGLSSVYVLQHQLNVYGWFNGDFSRWYDTYQSMNEGPKMQTVVNKSVRYLLNDVFSILIIHGLFNRKQYTQIAVGLLFFGLIVLLPAYFGLLFYAPKGFSSMISHLHRIILNPVLMMLLIPYLWMQERSNSEKSA